MSEDFSSRDYFALKARMASLFGLSVLPLLSSVDRLQLLAVVAPVVLITIATEFSRERIRTALVYATGVLVSVAIAASLSSQLVRMLFWLPSMTILVGLLLPKNASEKGGGG